MSNNSKQESENNFEVINQMSDFNFKEIDNIEVEVKPTNFEDIADKIATIHYVYQVMDKFSNCIKVNNNFLYHEKYFLM
ncbi:MULTISPECIES: hypothetical protein [unclassified Wolbachia]|uniref:hypothetical protein n=1 Tax=unclassified Wolbachia TaxID=2640676 RepID=UPI002226C069|nr:MULTISPECIES: hypothetical protein [unclassified Wolbachia]